MDMKRYIYIIALVLIPLIAKGEWETIPDSLPTARDQMASVMMGTTAYLIGGNEMSNNVPVPSDCVLSFDMLQREWVNDVPSLLFPRAGATAVVFNEKIYVIGGWGIIQHEDTFIETLWTTIEVWSPGQNFWQIACSLNQGREGAKAVVIGDSLIAVTGGYIGEDRYLNQITLLEPDSSGIYLNVSENDERFPPLPLPRAMHGAVYLDNDLFIFGGFYFGPLKDRYRLDNGGWEELDTLDYPLAGMAVTNLPDVDSSHFALISGGFKDYGLDSNVTIMDSQGDMDEFMHLPFPRANHSMLTTRIDESHIFIAGGTFLTERGPIKLRDVIVYPDDYTPKVLVGSRTNTPAEFNISAYPNPANNDARITISPLNTNDEIGIKIFDVLGRELSASKLSPATGIIEMSWSSVMNGRHIPAGTYFLAVHQGNRNQIIKLVRLP